MELCGSSPLPIVWPGTVVDPQLIELALEVLAVDGVAADLVAGASAGSAEEVGIDFLLHDGSPPGRHDVGYTHASNVAAVVRSREFESLTRTRSSAPSNRSAPYFPVVQVGPLVSVPVLLFPDLSAMVVPEPSSIE
jgi:hypothetical protein